MDKVYQYIPLTWQDEEHGHVSLNFVSLYPDSPTIYAAGSSEHLKVPVYANNLINGGNGKDKLYGDSKNFTIDITGTDIVADGDDAAVAVLDLDVTFGHDKLIGKNGNDQLFGDGDKFSVSLKAGDNAGVNANSAVLLGFESTLYFDFFGFTNLFSDPRLGNGFNVQDGLNVTFGNDHLIGGNGNDKAFGDIKYLQLSVTGGNDADGAYANAWYYPGVFNFGEDCIYGGNGRDWLFGDAMITELTTLSGSGSGNMTNASFSARLVFAGDDIYGNNGNDVIVGDTQYMTLEILGGSNTTFNPDGYDGDFGPYHFSEIFPTGLNAQGGIDFELINYGQDKLYGGNGNDRIFGDSETFLLKMKGADVADAKIKNILLPAEGL